MITIEERNIKFVKCVAFNAKFYQMNSAIQFGIDKVHNPEIIITGKIETKN